MINFLSAASRLDEYDKDDDFDLSLNEPLYLKEQKFVLGPEEDLKDIKKSPRSSISFGRNSSQYPYNAKDSSSSQKPFNLAPHLHPSLTRNSSIEALLPQGCYDAGDSSSDESETKNDNFINFRRRTIGEKIQSIFELPEAEILLHEFPCWLMNTVLLQGHLYMTKNFLLYYAHVPHDRNEVIKSGFLTRKTKAVYSSSYWFVLRDHSLAYFEDSTDVYYPYGMIDLKTVVSVQLSTTRPFGFKIFTVNKKYSLQTDSELSLKEWFQAMQKAVFRAKHSDHIKVVLPLSSVIDAELIRAFSFAQTLRIKSLESNFALDDHHFVFFERGEEAYRVIYEAIEESKEKNSSMKQNLISDKKIKANNLNQPMHQTMSAPAKEKKSLILGGKGILSNSSIFRLGHRKRLSLPGLSIFSPKNDSVETAVDESEDTSSESLDKTTSETSTLDLKAKTDSDNHTPSDQDQNENKLSSWLRLPSFPSLKTVRTQHEKSSSDQDPQNKEDTNAASSPVFFNFFSLNAPTLESFLPSEKNIHQDFALPPSETVLESFGCLFLRVVPRWGRLAITNHFLCFQSRIVGMAIKVIVPIGDIKQVERQPGLRLLHHGLSIMTCNSQEFFLEFKSSKSRDQALDLIEQSRAEERPEPLSSEALDASIRLTHSTSNEVDEESARQKHRWIQEFDMHNASLPLIPKETEDLTQFPPTEPMHITCLTIGTRGDVQPYIALCKGLMRHGHTCRIATHEEYKEWVESHGIEFRLVAGDPGELMKLCVDNGMFSISFLREGVAKFRTWIDELLTSAWEACQGTDVLIESPSAMAGIHIAEGLGIPFFGAFTMPWTRTRAFPHPFAIPEHPMGGSYNYMTYVLIEQVLWKGIGWQVNRWRRQSLNLPNVSLDQLNPHRVPFLYAFSPSLVPPPSDWHDWIHPTGFWFLDNPDPGWEPSKELEDFITSEPKPFYVGFGSITVPDPVEFIKTIIDAAVEANVKIILSEGWSSRMQGDKKSEIVYPDNVFPVKSIPHDWLFPKTAGVVHHGGAGTTSAGLRAGVPTIIKPFFGDQYFWAQQVEKMGAGVYLRRFTSSKLAAAFQSILEPIVVEKAAMIGQKIRSENGVETAIGFIYRDLKYAGSRINKSNNPTIKNPSQQLSSLNSPDLNMSFSRITSGNASPTGEYLEPDAGWFMVKKNSLSDDMLKPLSPDSFKSMGSKESVGNSNL